MQITKKKGTPQEWKRKPSKWEPLVKALRKCPLGESIELKADTARDMKAACAFVSVKLSDNNKPFRVCSRVTAPNTVVFWWTER